ncbi:MAG TPA: hypothetical protein VMY76_01930 [Gemmatimonadales bacterium]|nr:hypothetical protein [Gemmatimonadales bacterium]
MIRPFAPCWLVLLVALLVGPAVQRDVGVVWSDRSTVRHAATDGTPESQYVRTATTRQLAVDLRSRRLHPPLPGDGMLPAVSPAASPVFARLTSIRHALTAMAPARACRFPRFPTGPPSNA